MGLLLFLVLSFLMAGVSSLGEVPHNSCSDHKFKDDHHLHLNTSGRIHLTLHHPRSPCSPAPLPHLSFSDVLLHDDSRVRSLASRLTKPRPKPSAAAAINPSKSVSVPLNPGTSVGVGNYVTKIGLGTPSVNYIMVVDTGSSLSWLQCNPCKVSCHDQIGAIFNPSASATYHPVPCSAAECDGLQSATLNPSGCTRSNVCVYQASYGDSSFSVGYLSRDALTLGSSAAVLRGFVYGCGQDNEGLFGKSAGLVGLAKNKLSLLSQLAPVYGSAFSYCLPTTASTGFLSIGSYAPSKYAYTAMVTSSLDTTLYFIGLAGITVGGKGLPVKASAYTGTPTIIDSGTVITRLSSNVYAALSKAVAAAMKRYPRAAAYSILDTCFKGSLKGMAVPEVSMVFDGGAALKLPARSVLIDVDSSTTCLAFAATTGSVAIIGNRQQQTFSVVYDVARSKIGFAAGGCG